MSKGFEKRYEEWMGLVEEWADRHSISIESAISILFNDGSYNPNGKDFVTYRSLFGWVEVNDFGYEYLRRKNES